MGYRLPPDHLTETRLPLPAVPLSLPHTQGTRTFDAALPLRAEPHPLVNREKRLSARLTVAHAVDGLRADRAPVPLTRQVIAAAAYSCHGSVSGDNVRCLHSLISGPTETALYVCMTGPCPPRPGAFPEVAALTRRPRGAGEGAVSPLTFAPHRRRKSSCKLLIALPFASPSCRISPLMDTQATACQARPHTQGKTCERSHDCGHDCGYGEGHTAG